MVDNALIYRLEVGGLDDMQKVLITAHWDDEGVEAIEELDAGLVIYHDDQQLLIAKRTKLLLTFDWLVEDQIGLTSLENKNWNTLWESSFEPIIIPGFCTVKARFHNMPNDTPYTIVINPEMAFGTGHHETTYQMMVAMRDLPISGKRVLDYGCGTGILAILALHLGATHVDAIDHDPQATACAADCLAANQAEQISLYTGDLDIVKGNSYDIILANINRNVLLDNSSRIASLQSHQDILLLSGILETDFDIVVERYQGSGYVSMKRFQKGNWLCLQMMKM